MKRISVKKITLISLILAITLLILPNFISNNSSNVFADTTFSLKEVMDATKDFKNPKIDKESIDPEKIAGEFAKGIRTIGEFLIAAGWAISVGATIILGLQYFLAAGDPGKQAKVKEGLIGFVVAIVILSAAYPIWSFVVTNVSKIGG